MSTHLAICPNCRGEMDVTDVGPFTRVRCPGCDEEVRVKTEMGGYRLVRRIAFGGMSVVYVARDPTLDREIAVKVLSEEYSADRRREAQFEREAKLTAAVSHPNVVRVFTVGRAFDRFFIAMELVSGQSLEERLAVHGALPEGQVIDLALQVIDGLRAAQAAGLIHRDMKPGNILIDDKETAKIVDFGLSLLAEGGAAREEELWATPYYVAPEALERGEEDHRSDMYALGASLYHALAGVSPIETKEMSTGALREAKKHVPPLKKVAPWLSAETVRTVERAMARDPGKRFASYEEFRLGLETARGVLQAQGARLPVHGALRAQRRERQHLHRRAWMAGGVVLALLLATVVLLVTDKLRNAAAAVDEPRPRTLLDALGDNPGLDHETAMEISRTYEAARTALAEDDFVTAEQQFLRVWQHEKSPVPTAAWASFEAAVAASLDGRSGDARQHLVALDVYLREEGETDTQLGRRLMSAIELLCSLSFVPEETVPKVIEDPFRATTLLAFALKTWEQGQLARAGGMLAKLAGAGPWPEAEWMGTYRELAARYVLDFEMLSAADHEVEGKSRDELRQAVRDLDELYAALRTRGRARYNVKVWQGELLRKLRELESRRVSPHWKDLRDQLAADCAAARFAQAERRLAAAEVEGELEERQRDALLSLSREANRFLVDVQQALGPGASEVELRARNGDVFRQVLGSQEGAVLVEDQGAARSVAWGAFEPVSLLQLYRNRVDATEDPLEKARRLVQAAAYAWLNGFELEAKGLAAEAAALHPPSAKSWAGIVEVLRE